MKNVVVQIANLKMPTWTTLGRPTDPQEGEFGYNVETNELEVWGGEWHKIANADHVDTNFVKKTGDVMSGELATTVLGAATGNVLKFGDSVFGDINMVGSDVILQNGNPAVAGDGVSNITVSTTEPDSPADGDLWIDIS